MSDLLSMQGRFSRSRYIVNTLVITLVTYAFAFVAGIIMGFAGMGEDLAGIAGGVLGFIGQIVLAFACVKRLHDLGRPGWHFWLFLVPFYNIYLGLVMMFVKGASSANQFGPDPMAAAAHAR
jgi:uncharacterized membrane protein YhaH (DUF805 family)